MSTREPREEGRAARIVEATINGDDRGVLVQPWQTLLEVLRDSLSLTGSKECCGNGNCGACAVILDGRLVNSCLVLGVEVAGSDVRTIEGFGSSGRLDPLQQAFLESAAFQCGVCTPGFIVAASALLHANPTPTERDIRWWLAGNLCRCTGYDKIVRAVQSAASSLPEREVAPG
jgi:carbon-monoxide dehydrogenase small subunit